MPVVIAEFIDGKDQNETETGEAQRESQDVDDSQDFVPAQVADGDAKVMAEHMQLFFKICRQRNATVIRI